MGHAVKLAYIFFFFFLHRLGLCVLCSTVADQQAYSGVVHGKPRAVHEEEEARHHRSAADESSGQRGKAPKTDGEVQDDDSLTSYLNKIGPHIRKQA